MSYENKEERKRDITAFNFKNKSSKEGFLCELRNNPTPLNTFEDDEPFTDQARRFFKAFNRTIHKHFRRIRICNNDDALGEELKTLMDTKKALLKKKNEGKNWKGESELEDTDLKIKEKISKNIANKIEINTKESETLDGSFNQLKYWKLKQKLMNKSVDPPTAKVDALGNVITASEPLKALYLNTYKERLRNREIMSEYEDII